MEKIPADDRLSQKLQLPQRTSCNRIERVCFADDVPTAYCVDTIHENLLPKGLKEQTFQNSLFELLSKSGHPVSHTESYITPTLLTQQELPELNSESAYFLLFEELNYDVSGFPVCCSNDYYTSQVFEFKIIRSVPWTDSKNHSTRGRNHGIPSAKPGNGPRLSKGNPQNARDLLGFG